MKHATKLCVREFENLMLHTAVSCDIHPPFLDWKVAGGIFYSHPEIILTF